MRLTLAVLAVAAALPALADIEASFREGAPTDLLTIANIGGCALGPAEVVFDLTGSAGGLILDTAAMGPGTSSYRPVTILGGAAHLAEPPRTADGDRRLVLRLTDLPPGAAVDIALDLDDTRGTVRTRVSGEEMIGARLTVTTENGPNEGTFGADGRARAPGAFCGV